MSIRYKLLLGFGVVLLLAAGVALYGIRAISDAGDLVVRLYDQSFMATSSTPSCRTSSGSPTSATSATSSSSSSTAP